LIIFPATNNILYDPDTKTISGLIDFDFSLVSNPYHEYVSSFASMGGSIADERLSGAITSGAFDRLASEDDKVDAEELAVAKEWDSALASHGALKPSEITGIRSLQMLSTFEDLLCPYVLYHPFLSKRFGKEQLLERKTKAEEALLKFLTAQGF
jgi:hypothetical protein